MFPLVANELPCELPRPLHAAGPSATGGGCLLGGVHPDDGAAAGTIWRGQVLRAVGGTMLRAGEGAGGGQGRWKEDGSQSWRDTAPAAGCGIGESVGLYSPLRTPVHVGQRLPGWGWAWSKDVQHLSQPVQHLLQSYISSPVAHDDVEAIDSGFRCSVLCGPIRGVDIRGVDRAPTGKGM